MAEATEKGVVALHYFRLPLQLIVSGKNYGESRGTGVGFDTHQVSLFISPRPAGYLSSRGS